MKEHQVYSINSSIKVLCNGAFPLSKNRYNQHIFFVQSQQRQKRNFLYINRGEMTTTTWRNTMLN